MVVVPLTGQDAVPPAVGTDVVVAFAGGDPGYPYVLGSVLQTLGADAWDEREGLLEVYLDARLCRSGPVSNELALNFIAKHVLGLPAHT